MRGRKPTPTHLKILSGNPGHRPLNAEEPIPPGDLYSPPEWLTDQQRVDWRYAIDSAPKGLLRNLDRDLLAGWIAAADLHRQAIEDINREGRYITVGGGEETTTKKDGSTRTVKKPGQRQQHPAVSIKNKQFELMMRAASELGFTPTSRSRIRLGGAASPSAPAAPEAKGKFANNATRRYG